MFLKKSLTDDTISQFKLQGDKLADALFDFVKHEFDFDSLETGAEDGEDNDDGIDSLL